MSVCVSINDIILKCLICTSDGLNWSRLISEDVIVWRLIENITKCIFYNQCECIENIGTNFFKDVIPIFVQETICAVTQQFITVVKVLEVED